MRDIEREFYNFIKKNSLIGNEDGVLAAVSGGADSMCMLSLLMDYCANDNIRLGVVHVNHGFRPEAVNEADYVRRFCEDHSIPFFLKEIEPGSCRNSEEEARIRRYSLMEEVATTQGFTKLALAHNAQDRAETMFFNMFRGTGLTGLIGIRPYRFGLNRENGVIRPILFLSRNRIENYLNQQGISYCTDATNLEDNYNRNKIRHHIIPVAQEINPMSISHLSEISDRLIRIENYINKQSEIAFNLVHDSSATEMTLNVPKYNKLDVVIRMEIIRKAIKDMTPHLKDISAEHIESVDRLASKSDNGQISLPYGIIVYKEYDNLTFICQKNISEETVLDDRQIRFRVFDRTSLDGDVKNHIPRNEYTKWFDYDKINASLQVRYREENDRIIIDNEGHTKTLNRLMIDLKIPSRYRDQIPVIAAGENIVWLVGYRDSAGYRINEETKTILEIRLLEEKENG